VSLTLRDAAQADQVAILEVIRRAFPDEDLVPLVSTLLSDPDVLTRVAEYDGTLCGVICWSFCAVGTAKVALLGPLAVVPRFQKQRVGAALIEDGWAALEAHSVVQAVVLGDPAYYGRFGFREETGVQTPYPLPDAWRPAWQGIALAGPLVTGPLEVPTPWQVPELWLP